jgi:hypothetical protein
MAYVFFTLDMLSSSVSTTGTGIMWYILTYQKIQYSKWNGIEGILVDSLIVYIGNRDSGDDRIGHKILLIPKRLILLLLRFLIAERHRRITHRPLTDINQKHWFLLMLQIRIYLWGIYEYFRKKNLYECTSVPMRMFGTISSAVKKRWSRDWYPEKEKIRTDINSLVRIFLA